MKLIEPPTGCDHRESLRPGAFYYCNKAVQFFALSAATSQAGPDGVSLAGFCGLQHANVEPKPTLDAARQFHDRMLAEGCPCGNCDAAAHAALTAALIDCYPYPVAAADSVLTGPERRQRHGVARGLRRGSGRLHRGSAARPRFQQGGCGRDRPSRLRHFALGPGAFRLGRVGNSSTPVELAFVGLDTANRIAVGAVRVHPDMNKKPRNRLVELRAR